MLSLTLPLKCSFGIDYGIGRKDLPIWVLVLVLNINKNNGFGRTLYPLTFSRYYIHIPENILISPIYFSPSFHCWQRFTVSIKKYIYQVLQIRIILISDPDPSWGSEQNTVHYENPNLAPDLDLPRRMKNTKYPLYTKKC